jgi:phospho-N-acetylmuramoyl-pentapeptide-transferase
MANSVNITDGLDGLAGWMLVMCYSVYAFICYDSGLFILTGLCLIIIGALISFLWFNIKPAQFYMGDVGSLSLGATLAILALMTDTLIVLWILSLLFLFEAFSSFIQVLSKKLRQGKKIFLIAPFHHHLEAKGWHEETIVMRFWLIEMILSVIALVIYFSL